MTEEEFLATYPPEVIKAAKHLLHLLGLHDGYLVHTLNIMNDLWKKAHEI